MRCAKVTFSLASRSTGGRAQSRGARCVERQLPLRVVKDVARKADADHRRADRGFAERPEVAVDHEIRVGVDVLADRLGELDGSFGSSGERARPTGSYTTLRDVTTLRSVAGRTHGTIALFWRRAAAHARRSGRTDDSRAISYSAIAAAPTSKVLFSIPARAPSALRRWPGRSYVLRMGAGLRSGRVRDARSPMADEIAVERGSLQQVLVGAVEHLRPIQHQDPLCAQRRADPMSDDDQRSRAVCKRLLDEGLGGRVEVAASLVEDDQPCRRYVGPDQRDELTLAR